LLFFRLGALTDAIVTQHNSLRGIAAQLAEIYYIVGAQQLEGYGQECFLAKVSLDIFWREIILKHFSWKIQREGYT